MAFKLVYHSQNDPQWKADLLGFGEAGDTIGYVGCALTSIAMLLSGHGYAETPRTLNQKLKDRQGFVSSGIRWDVVSQVHPQVRLRGNISCETTDAPLARIDASLAAGQPVVVRVDNSPAPGLQWHYVLLYARKGNDYLMLDPWPYQPGTTKEDLLMPRYSQGNPLQRSIQQVLLYECATSDGTISMHDSSLPTPGPPPQTQPGPVPAAGILVRPAAEVTSFMFMRSSPDTSSTANVVTQIHPGTQLILEPGGEVNLGLPGLWVRVRDSQGHEGFAAAWLLERVPGAAPVPSTEPAPMPVSEAPAAASTPAPASTKTTPPPAPEKEKLIVKVRTGGLRIYAKASNSSAVVATEKSDARLTVVEAAATARLKIGKTGKWIQVKGTNNKRGYAQADKVKLL
jgi:hypothetical protein